MTAESVSNDRPVLRSGLASCSSAWQASAEQRDRAPWLRHAALFAATVAAYMLRFELHVSMAVLWVIALAAAGNLVVTHLARARTFVAAAPVVSSVFGLCGWTALVALTGALRSPFVAGFWLEIVLSALVFRIRGTMLVAASCAGALAVMQLAYGPRNALWRLLVQISFIGVFGAVTTYASWRATRTQQQLMRELDVLTCRMQSLERELVAGPRFGQMGFGIARLAHGLKNAVHSLRGLAKLIEHQSSAAQRPALDCLGLAIDRLEETVRETLKPRPANPVLDERAASEFAVTFHEIVDEITLAHPGQRWVKLVAKRLPPVALSSTVMREVLQILAQNAVEASADGSEIVVRAEVEGGLLCVAVQDHGPGFSPGITESLFSPGATTKASGSGFGLFLARQLVESSGGA